MPLSPCTGIKSQNDETIREFVYANKYLSLSLSHRYNTDLGARLNSVEYHVEGGASRANSMTQLNARCVGGKYSRVLFSGREALNLIVIGND